jgi:hypothetical protein
MSFTGSKVFLLLGNVSTARRAIIKGPTQSFCNMHTSHSAWTLYQHICLLARLPGSHEEIVKPMSELLLIHQPSRVIKKKECLFFSTYFTDPLLDKTGR